MGMAAAKAQRPGVATDTHIVMVPAGPSLVPTPLPHPFSGDPRGRPRELRQDRRPARGGRRVDRQQHAAAHLPTPPGTTFQTPPSNKATIKVGSASVRIEGNAAARHGDIAMTCNDPADLPVGTRRSATGTVKIGG